MFDGSRERTPLLGDEPMAGAAALRGGETGIGGIGAPATGCRMARSVLGEGSGGDRGRGESDICRSGGGGR